MRNILFLSFLICSSNLFSQIVITDTNKKAIPFVQIISNNKYFFAQTNLKGELNLTDIKNLSAVDTLFFHHVAYETVFKIKKELSTIDTIKLQQKTYQLGEFTVSSKEQKNKYQKLNACYRSFQANNDSMAYYTDGKAEYLSKINKDDYKLLRKECRAFVNKKLEEETTQRKTGITFLPTIPRPPIDYLPAKYYKQHNLKYVQLENGRTEIFYRDSILIGEIEKNNNQIKYSINDINSGKTRKILNTEVNLKKFEVIMLFRNNGFNDVSEINNFDDLLYIKNLREYKIKHNKDKDFTKIYIVDEMFIEDVLYTNTLGNEEYKSSWGFPKKSDYKSEFWLNCNCKAYYIPIEKILRGLNLR